VQQVVGIVTEPLLIRPGDVGVVQASEDARPLLLGLSNRWPEVGIGPVRLAIAAAARAPILFVRSGLHRSGLIPPQTLTVHVDARLVGGRRAQKQRSQMNALDRRALAAAVPGLAQPSGAIPAIHVLAPELVGASDAPAYKLGGSPKSPCARCRSTRPPGSRGL
jgi:hypothetical protein